MSSSNIDGAIRLGRLGAARHSRARYIDQSGVPLLLVDGIPFATEPPQLQFAIKRVLDVLFSVLGLIALSPLMLVSAVAIRLDDGGPVIFAQRREGFRGQFFTLYKFRTMSSWEGAERITRLGQYLRQSHLDELPQLWNVVIGDMSLVGPRPHVPDMMVLGRRYIDVVPYYRLRFAHMKPGLTGWAQANGLCGSVNDLRHARQRIDHDIAYTQNFSLMLDLKSIFRTALGRGG